MPQHTEHFNGPGLPADWTPIVAGTGSVSVSGSQCVLSLSSNGDSAAIVKPFDRTKSQMFLLRGRADSAASPQPSIQIIDSASQPVCDLRANMLNLCRLLIYTAGSDYSRMNYINTSGTTQNWRDSDKSWQTGGTIVSVPNATPREDYREWGFEWDAEGQRMRMFSVHQSFGSSENLECGPRLYSVTGWVSFSSIRGGSSSNLWIVVGWPETNFYTSSASAYIEVVKQTWGPRVYVLCNGKASGGRYRITSHSGYDLTTGLLLPDNPGGFAIDYSTAGNWDSQNVQWGSIIRTSSGLYVSSYSGNNTANVSAIQIGVASASDPTGTWTKHANNPVIALGPSGSTYESYMRFNVLVEDLQEEDPNKRFKMIVTATDATTTTRTVLFSAPDWFGPYTYEGVLLEEDATETGIAFRGQPVWYKGQWNMFYNCDVAGVNVVRRAVSKHLRAGTFVKEGVTLNEQSQNSGEWSVTAVSGRVITVSPNTTGMVKDMNMVGTNSSSTQLYAMARVRQVIDANNVEMYETMPGLNTSSVLRSTNIGSDNSLNHVSVINGIWYFSMTMFKVFTSHPTFGAHHEGNGVYVGGAKPTDPMNVDWTATPLVPFGRDAWDTGISNENTRICTEWKPFASLAPVIRRRRSTLIRR